MPKSIQIDTIVSAGFEENCYVAYAAEEGPCFVVDPGLEPERILKHLDKHGLQPAAILNTHGHYDHTAGNAPLKERWPDCPVVIGADEAFKLQDPQANLSAGFGLPMVCPPADATVKEGDSYSAAGFDLRVLHVPGHSSGHVVFILDGEDGEPATAFVGDVIFAGGVGRSDFPDGDWGLLEKGIREKIYTMPDDTVLLSGHGPPTTVGREKASNPFVRA